jgi:hypothetical protein
VTKLVQLIARAEDPEGYLDGAAVCSGCYTVLDHTWVSPTYVVRNRHASVAMYGPELVAERFIEAVAGVEGCSFQPLPADPEYSVLVIDRVAVVDRASGKFVVGAEPCPVCGRVSVHGWPSQFINQADLSPGFWRTDLLYGGTGAQVRHTMQIPRLLVDAELGARLTKMGLARFKELRP